MIHRDLKPANILLDREGTPKVTDFGLAKQIEKDSGLTGTGQILGTPSYMSPEQASGRIQEISQSSDVFAIAAILYCLLNGRPPFQAANVMDTLWQVLERELIPLRRFDRGIPKDLETIRLKALAKESHRRYHSATKLADDLERWLASEPILAGPVNRIEKTWLWCRRRPAVAGLLSLVAVAILFASGALALQHRANQQSRVKSMVNSLLQADISRVSATANLLADYQAIAAPLLRERLRGSKDDSPDKLRLAVALAPTDSDVLAYLRQKITVCSPQEFLIVIEALRPVRANSTDELWRLAQDKMHAHERRFQAAAALAVYPPRTTAGPVWLHSLPSI